MQKRFGVRCQHNIAVQYMSIVQSRAAHRLENREFKTAREKSIKIHTKIRRQILLNALKKTQTKYVGLMRAARVQYKPDQRTRSRLIRTFEHSYMLRDS